jgi:Histidine kinase
MDSFFSRLALSDHQRYRLGRHFLFWFLCWAFMGFIYGFLYTGENRIQYFALSYLEALLYLPQHMLLSYGIIYFILPQYIFKGRYWPGIGGVLVLILMVSFLSPLILTFVINPIRLVLNSPAGVGPSRTIFYSLMAGLRGSMTVAGFAVAIKLVKLWYLKKVDNERLEKATLRAELETLKGQLHPHFLFNTLNSIYSLALKKSDYTPEAILKLSQLMRYILTECNNTTIELPKEVQVLHHYIDLEKNRFGNRLDISLNIQGDIYNNRIPPLLLMPFLENSFKHGANEMTEQAWISMDLDVDGHLLKFKLINGKPRENVTGKDSSQIGLFNVQRRLALLYPNAHELRITNDDDTFVVVLTIHLDKVKLPDAS